MKTGWRKSRAKGQTILWTSDLGTKTAMILSRCRCYEKKVVVVVHINIGKCIIFIAKSIFHVIYFEVGTKKKITILNLYMLHGNNLAVLEKWFILLSSVRIADTSHVSLLLSAMILQILLRERAGIMGLTIGTPCDSSSSFWQMRVMSRSQGLALRWDLRIIC